MVFSKISQVAHYAPKQLVTNDDLANIMDTSHEWIFSRTGIAQRHIAREELTSDLASRVAEQLLTKSGLAADAIDFIIVATISPDGTM
ncbi:3-oxoacyl-ACP synthase, partial [Streptococcus dysgalactiae]